MTSLTLKRTLVMAVFLLIAAMVTRPQVADPDVYWHIRSGQVMLENRAIIDGDVFSHTMTGVLRPHHEWLSEVLIGAIYQAFGHYGITALASVLTLTALWLIYRLLDGALTVRLILLLVAAHVSLTTAMSRPLAWMLIFMVVLTGMVLRKGPSPRWIPLIMLAWGNLHGGWSGGVIVLGAAVAAEMLNIAFKRAGDVAWLRRLILWSLGGALALLVNPYGFDQLLVPLETFTQAALPYINEWMPPDLTAVTRYGYLLLMVLAGVVILHQRGKMPLLHLFLLVGFGLWGLRTSRVVLIYAFIAPIILSPYLSDLLRQYAPRLDLPEDRLNRPFRFGLPVIALLSVMIGVQFIQNSSPAKILEIQRTTHFPVDAVAFLHESDAAERQLFHPYGWGGYLIFYLREYPVFIDGRGDMYDELFFVYRDVVRLQGDWTATLDKYEVNTVLMPPDSELAKALQTETGWGIIYQDDTAVILTRP